MIPKIIHYCWFGRGQMPELALYCIESWKKYLPDYELRLWNEDTFDVNSVPYVKEAYSVQKYAFVTDYIRLWALNKFGGIYLDTDVEILKPLDQFLTLPAFSGYEVIVNTSFCPIMTGLMASEAGGTWVQEQLAYYNNKHFLKRDGTFANVFPNTNEPLPNPITITKIMQDNGFVADGKYSVYKGNMHVFPTEYFCPMRWDTKELVITENTFCIHHFSGSWLNVTATKKTKSQRFFFFIGRCKRWLKKKLRRMLNADA